MTNARCEVDGKLLTITFDRPERKNALSVEAMNELTEAWARLEADTAARVAKLTSSGCGVFSAGLDLKQAAEIRARDGVDILTLMRDLMQSAMREVTRPSSPGWWLSHGRRHDAGSQGRPSGGSARDAPVLLKSRWDVGRHWRLRCTSRC